MKGDFFKYSKQMLDTMNYSSVKDKRNQRTLWIYSSANKRNKRTLWIYSSANIYKNEGKQCFM